MDEKTAKLIARIAENLPAMESDVMDGWIDNPRALKRFLSDLNPPEGVHTTDSTLDILDYVVRVDRSVKPSYPDFVKKLMHPELEFSGPAKYDLRMNVWQCLYDAQRIGVTSGLAIYDYLKRENLLADCLGLVDLLAIQGKGIAVFRKLYANKAVFGWKSVAKNNNEDLLVPYLFENGDKIAVGWRWLDHGWFSRNPALYFSK